MRVKSNKALRGSAHLSSVSAIDTPSSATAFCRRPGCRVATANSVAAAVAGILYGSSGAVWAQQAQQAQQAPEAAPATAPNTGSLQEVVVTANAQAGIKKLDASYNIVSANDSEIKMANPLSSADILKLSPGIWPESSGGQTGANIEVAGFPSGGDAPYFTNMIEGLPMYGMPNLSFMDSSSLFRLDNTIERLEIVQGGPSSIFGPGQMGATANYILKTGSATPTGEVGMTYGNEGLWRVDAFYGFPIADGWYGSVGGFWRQSEGVRPPSFPADSGGQFTATLKHDLNDGSLMFYGRVLDDKNQFIVPVPVIQSASGTNFSGYPGFCALKCSYGSLNIQNVSVPHAGGGFESADLANGRGGNLYYFGSKYEQKFGEWSLLNNFIIDGGGLDTNALFSGPNPRPLGYMLYGCQMAQPAGYCNPSTNVPVDANNYAINSSGGISYPNTGGAGTGLPLNYNVQATYAGTGQPVPLNTSVLQQGWWYIQKSLQNIADEFRASRTLFDGNTLTGGVYLTFYTDNDNWSLGNQMLMANRPNTTPIVLQYLSGGSGCNAPTSATNVHTCHLSSSQGFINNNNNFDIIEHGDAHNIAGFLSDTWRFGGGFLFDAGVRLENIHANQRTCNQSNVQMGSAFDLWDNAVPTCNGTYNYETYIHTMPTYTGGLNYEFNDHTAAYIRANTGVHFDDFDNGIRDASTNPAGFLPIQTVTNYEFGFKFQNRFSYVDISAYQRTFDGLSYQETTPSGTPIPGAYSTYGAKTKGVDLVGTLTPLTGLNIRVVGDYMDGHYEGQNACAPSTNIFGQQQCLSFNGQPLQRQPKWQVRATPSYTFPASWGDVTAWVTYEYVGQRFEDQTGLQPLGTYYMLGAGIVANVSEHWQFRIQGTNLTNQIGLTEGNARKLGQATGIGGVLMARPIEGQEINFGVFYKF